MIKFRAFYGEAWEDYLCWQATDKQMVKRINALIEDSLRNPIGGIGKPEPLKNEYKGCWSKRIEEEHRLVYKVIDGHLYILQCRYHYTK